ncbi:MAG TPA: alpha/beta hydrolase [Polyangiales bacterium]
MSLQATLVSSLLRRFVKASEDKPLTANVRKARAAMEQMGRVVPKPPRDVQVASVDAGGVPAEWLTAPRSRSDRVVLYLHGGYYVAGSPRSHRNLTWRLAQQADARVLALDYRLAPEHPYPAALEDVLRAHRWLIDQGISRIAWAGDSAGGGLAFSALHAAREAGLAAPCAIAAISPWTDLAGAGPSWTSNKERDPSTTTESLRHAAALYCGSVPTDHPGVSPAYASFEAAPPVLIHVGELEVLVDDAQTIAARLRAAGAPVEVRVWPSVPHVWHLLAPYLPESITATREIAAFLQRHWA